jgi:hypothetical protein
MDTRGSFELFLLFQALFGVSTPGEKLNEREKVKKLFGLCVCVFFERMANN